MPPPPGPPSPSRAPALPARDREALAVRPEHRAGARAQAQDRASPRLRGRQRRLHRADALARRARRVVGEQEVLAQREAEVVGRHVDAAQVAVALEDDAEHVVGLALGPLGPAPEERDGGHARVVAGEAVGDDPHPGRAERRPEVVDDLHRLARVDAGEVGEDLVAQRRGPRAACADVRHRAGRDDELERVARAPPTGTSRCADSASSRRRTIAVSVVIAPTPAGDRSDPVRDGRADAALRPTGRAARGRAAGA